MVPCMYFGIFLLLVDVMFIGVLIIYLDFISFALLCLFSYSICFPYMGPLFASTAKGPVGHEFYLLESIGNILFLFY